MLSSSAGATWFLYCLLLERAIDHQVRRLTVVAHPLYLMKSFLRSVSQRKPSLSILVTSPVLNQPSSKGKTSIFASWFLRPTYMNTVGELNMTSPGVPSGASCRASSTILSCLGLTSGKHLTIGSECRCLTYSPLAFQHFPACARRRYDA